MFLDILSVIFSQLLAADESYFGLDYAMNKIGSAPEASQRAPIIEICPTSNSYTLQLSNLKEHPTLGKWIDTGYPIAISTGANHPIFIALHTRATLITFSF
jgi:hypothetical protein